MAIVTCKPFEAMTLAELRAEHSAWVKATSPGSWAYRYDKGHDTRDTIAGWIALREAEMARAEREGAAA